jgi:hypothetical protein
VFGGLEPLRRYNPHKTEGFLIVKALRSRYRGVTGVTNAAAGAATSTQQGRARIARFDCNKQRPFAVERAARLGRAKNSR